MGNFFPGMALVIGASSAHCVICRWSFVNPTLKEESIVQRVCFLLKVKEDRIAEYKARHESVWPEMLEALRETGWHNYSLFLRDDGLLVGYFETPDLEAALAGMANRAVNERWQNEIAPFFEELEGQRPDEGLLLLEEVFHLE